MPTTQIDTYNTLEEIQMRRDQLSESIEQDKVLIGNLWGELFTKREDATKGELIASIVTKSITAIDAFLMVRKLINNYGHVLSFLGLGSKRKKKKK